ncbi:MAG: hypothetical protein KBE09_05445 [Candidatus Pacebacteria bacterium]|nr:hypothetical protein [Candidatus Paceibacterota bacterium]
MPFVLPQRARTTPLARAHTDIPRSLFSRVAALLEQGRSYAHIADELRTQCPGLKPARVSSVIKKHARNRDAFIAQYRA